MARTSASDKNSYTSVCLKAAEDETVFANFRRNRAYRLILGNDPYGIGKEHLNVILSQNPELIEIFPKFRESDQFGNPLVGDYGKYGKFSPTTLRYIKTLGDLKSLFGSLDGKNIIEIGGGYGGQCKIISDLFSFKSYTIVDLNPVLKLTRKYLDCFNVNNVHCLAPENLGTNENYDLVISNYAFTELTRETQQSYIEQILLRSTQGYIAMNDFFYSLLFSRQYSREELLKTIKNSLLINEVPLTFPKNSTLIWNQLQKADTSGLYKRQYSHLLTFFKLILDAAHSNLFRKLK
ncbi:MAG: putative sugar O-methyltransferase [Candidatus Anammoxibacter sp.]